MSLPFIHVGTGATTECAGDLSSGTDKSCAYGTILGTLILPPAG